MPLAEPCRNLSGPCRGQDRGGSPWCLRAGPGSQGLSHPQPGAGQRRTTGQLQPLASGTSLGMGTGRGWDVGPRVGPARQGPWLGRTRLWGAGDRPCCGITGTGADGPGGLTWGPGLWAGWGGALGGLGRASKACQGPEKTYARF